MLKRRTIILFALSLVLLPMTAKAIPIDNVEVTSDDKGYNVRLSFLIYEFRVLSSSGDNPGEEVRIHLQLANRSMLSSSQVADLASTQLPSWDTTVNVPLDTITYQGGTDNNNLELDITFSRPVHFSIQSSPDQRELTIHIDAPAIASNDNAGEKGILPPAVTSVVTVKPASSGSATNTGRLALAKPATPQPEVMSSSSAGASSPSIQSSVPGTSSQVPPSQMVSPVIVPQVIQSPTLASIQPAPSLATPSSPVPLSKNPETAPLVIEGTAPIVAGASTATSVVTGTPLQTGAPQATTAVEEIKPTAAVEPVQPPLIVSSAVQPALSISNITGSATAAPVPTTVAPETVVVISPVASASTNSVSPVTSVPTVTKEIATSEATVQANPSSASAASPIIPSGVGTSVPGNSTPTASIVTDEPSLSTNIIVPDELKESTIPPSEAEELNQAKQNIIQKKYMDAVVIYNKLLKNSSVPATRMQATEFRGVAFEKSGLLADARASYENYLKDFPKSPYLSRIQQRLEALETASDPIRPRLAEKPAVVSQTTLSNGQSGAVVSGTEAVNPSLAPAAPVEESWTNTVFGSINSQYNYDVFHTSTGGVKSDATAQNGFYEYLDTSDTLRKGSQEIITRFSGSDQTPLGLGHAQGNIDTLSIETSDRTEGYVARFGRQGATSGGVLGRFDGFFYSQKVDDDIKINLVGGLPVDSSHSVPNVNRDFIGVSSDIAAFDKKWNFNVYGIEQLNKGYTDRRAIGGEARTGNGTYSLYTAAEFDVNLDVLNSITLNGSWNLPDYHASLYGTLDYRRTPLAMVSNALNGQTNATTLPELHKIYTDSQIDQLAIDRTTITKTATLGARYEFNKDFQVSPDFSVTNTGDMVASGGVPASPSLGNQYTYGFTTVNSNVLEDNDNIVASLHYGKYSYGDSYNLNLSDSYPVNESFNMGLSLNGGYLTSNIQPTQFSVGGTPKNYRINYGPGIRADYRYTNNLSFNFNAACTWSHDYSSTQPVHTFDQSASMGVRYSF